MKTRKVIWGVCIVLAVVLILTVFSFARKMHYVRLAKAHEGVYVSESGASFEFRASDNLFLLWWDHKAARFTYYYPENKGSAGLVVDCVSADHWFFSTDPRLFDQYTVDLKFLPDGSAELYYNEYKGIFIKTE